MNQGVCQEGSQRGSVRRWQRHWVTGLLAICMWWLSGCATTPYEGKGKAHSDALLQRQHAAALASLPSPGSASERGRLIFAGFAMNSLSSAFQGDVEVVEKWVRDLDPNAVVYKLNNPMSSLPWSSTPEWPYATAENIHQVLKQVAAMARPQDKVIVLMSTHGAVNRLAVHFGQKDYPALDAAWLQKAFLPLRGQPTLLLLSACFSGSLIEPLSAPERVILTAAAKDRASFGCQTQSKNTYFIDAFAKRAMNPTFSITRIMTQAQHDIAAREQREGLKPPSMPQIFVGTAATTWANQSINTWIQSSAGP